MLSFALYLIGAVVVIAGVAWIATLLGAASAIVTGTAALMFVIAIILAALNRRAIGPPAA